MPDKYFPPVGTHGEASSGEEFNDAMHLLHKIQEAATRYPRCCDLSQDSLGGMHCSGCAQKTFAMMREIQQLLRVGKDCKPLEEKGDE